MTARPTTRTELLGARARYAIDFRQPLDFKRRSGVTLTADESSNSKHNDGPEERVFHRKVLINFAPRGLVGCKSEEEGGTVPPDVCDGFELVGDPGYGGSNDCLTHLQRSLGHAECLMNKKITYQVQRNLPCRSATQIFDHLSRGFATDEKFP